jgi:hypothetical protein
VNWEAMSEHLHEISAMVATGAHALVVCDGAGWHQPGERLRLPDKLSLLRLPPDADRVRHEAPIVNAGDLASFKQAATVREDVTDAR